MGNRVNRAPAGCRMYTNHTLQTFNFQRTNAPRDKNAAQLATANRNMGRGRGGITTRVFTPGPGDGPDMRPVPRRDAQTSGHALNTRASTREER